MKDSFESFVSGPRPVHTSTRDIIRGILEIIRAVEAIVITVIYLNACVRVCVCDRDFVINGHGRRLCVCLCVYRVLISRTVETSLFN